MFAYMQRLPGTSCTWAAVKGRCTLPYKWLQHNKTAANVLLWSVKLDFWKGSKYDMHVSSYIELQGIKMFLSSQVTWSTMHAQSSLAACTTGTMLHYPLCVIYKTRGRSCIQYIITNSPRRRALFRRSYGGLVPTVPYIVPLHTRRGDDCRRWRTPPALVKPLLL